MKASESLTQLIEHLYHENGKTDQEIANITGCSQSLVNRIRHGRRSIGGSSLDLILRLFPELDGVIAEACRAKLEGRPVSMQQQANGNTNSQISQTMGADAGLSRVKDYQLRLYQQLVDMDIPDDAKLKLMQLIKSTPTE